MELFPGVDHAYLVRIATSLVGAQEAEDLVQAAYLKALASQHRREASATTWLHAIVKNLCLNHLRDAGRRHPVPAVRAPGWAEPG